MNDGYSCVRRLPPCGRFQRRIGRKKAGLGCFLEVCLRGVLLKVKHFDERVTEAPRRYSLYLQLGNGKSCVVPCREFAGFYAAKFV